jgi:hypothetical protein
MNFMFILLCEFFVVSEDDEMNYDIVFAIFYNVFLGANFGYMQ